tara:strand:- start:21927 stop:22595 length:669 start_codon:yes stop_codon:yes gene_type:complete
MTTSVVNIWNQALSAAGGKGTVSAVGESSREADLAGLWWETVRDGVFRTASWPCTKAYSRLALLTERDENADWVLADPAPGWRYAYAVPSEMIAPRFLHSYDRFELMLHNGDNALMTNEENAVLQYSFRQTDVSLWDSGLTQAVIFALAAQLCYPLSAKLGQADRLKATAYEFILENRTEIANQTDNHAEDLAPWVSVRGYEGTPRPTRFFYPYTNLNIVAS